MSREAAVANSLRRQPEESGNRDVEPRGDARFIARRLCRCFAAHLNQYRSNPWADAQGYLLPSLRDSEMRNI